MSEVRAFRRPQTMLWIPPGGGSIVIHNERELAAKVSTWHTYGDVAEVRREADGRTARVTALGEDGWLVKVRHPRLVSKKGWPGSKIITRVVADGSRPSRSMESPWYAPGDTSDLAGSVLLADEIQVSPTEVAAAIWSWLNGNSLPAGYATTTPRRDPVACDSVTEALAWLVNSADHVWPDDAAQEMVVLADELNVDRVIVTSPAQIILRLKEAEKRVRFQLRGEGAEAYVRVLGMVDELGREYIVRLPGREVLRVLR